MLPKILAPAGSPESLRAAVLCGANAVYLGGKSFSARQNASNFSDEELEEAIRFCHLRGVKVHQAINTLAFDSQLEEVRNTALRSAELGVDAFIVQDLGALKIIRSVLPDMPLHASTQMSVHTKDGALLMKEMGFSRVVVSRELSLMQIREICQAPIEVEVFVHGALCMSVSGQCYMSAMIGSRSANRGLCAQACRLPFSADSTEHYALSLKDLSYVSELDKLKDAGVASLKIEGRMKRPEYVAAAVSAVKASLSGENADMSALRAVFSRQGFTNGYLEEKLGSDMFGTRVKDDVTAAKDILPELEKMYEKEAPSLSVSFFAELKKDEKSSLAAKYRDVSVYEEGDVPDLAVNKAIDSAALEQRLSRLGGTPFYVGDFECDIDDGLFLSAASLNELRRKTICALEEKIVEKNTPRYKQCAFKEEKATPLPKKKAVRLFLSDREQLPDDLSDIEAVIIPIEKRAGVTPSEKIYLSLPRFVTDETALKNELSIARKEGFMHIYCSNLSHIYSAKKEGFILHGGYGLNIMNSLAAKELASLGLRDAEASFEMKLTQLSHLSSPIPIGIVAYGKLPLMLTRNCPIKAQVGCKGCKKTLTDRTNRIFPVKCSRDYAEILNSDVLYLADRLDELEGASFLTLMMYDETKEQVSSLINAYRLGKNPPESFTRGLYYRGIL